MTDPAPTPTGDTAEAPKPSAPVLTFQPRRTFRDAHLAEHGDFGLVPDGADPRSIPMIGDAR